MPQTSSSVVHVQLATACQFLMVTFIRPATGSDFTFTFICHPARIRDSQDCLKKDKVKSRQSPLQCRQT